MWTVLEMLRWTERFLAGKGIAEPRLNAELLLAGVLGLKRLDLYLQFDRPLRPDELAGFKAHLLRRARGEPLQYIARTAHFRELRLRVDARVLIPRPETEVLVGEVLRWAQGRGPLSALDVGTGSGAIALSLAAEGPFSRVVATDLSAHALAVARENHQLAAPDAPVEFREGSLFEPVAGERFAVVVSNPPYVGDAERPELDAGVRDWEPEMALFSGHAGLDVIEHLVAGAAEHLEPGGLLALEIGATQAAAVSAMIRAEQRFREPMVLRDLSGRERIVLADLG